ncbi:MAG: hypothetical protein JRL30_19360 [Deltaproteobacteria bacterium]|nr:hypothetical protein [Deltaproteobacteria bacterium]
MKWFRNSALAAALLIALGTPSLASDFSEGSAKEEILKLKEMILELQRRVRQLEQGRDTAGDGTSAEAGHPVPARRKRAPSAASSPKAKGVAKTPSIPKKKEVASVGADAPAPLEIGGHEVRVGIQGAVQLDVIHDFNALGLTSGGGVEREFVTADIPVGGAAAEDTNRTGFSPNQSYLTGWAETDTPWGPVRVYADVNLMGSTTDTKFQIYKAYGQWGWLKAGHDYTLWLNQAAMPDTLDFEGPNAVPEIRFTQASLKIPLDPGSEKRDLFFTVGVEDAEGDITVPKDSSVHAVDQFPTLIGKLSYEPDWAHMELGGLYRRLKAEGPGYNQSVDGWGVTLSGTVTTWKNDSFIWGLQYGDGLGAYIQDTSGLGLDAAPTSRTNSSLKVIPAFGAWAAYQHWWTQSLRSTASYGFVRMDTDFDLWPHTPGTGTFKQTQYASANLVWSPWPPFDVGLEYLFGHRTVTERTAVDGNTTGQDHRLQFTMRWNFGWRR